MRAQFEVENSAYPIAALPDGNGWYYVTNMIGLDRMHDAAIPHEAAVTIARKGNGLHRASRQQGWTAHGIQPEVAALIREEVELFVSASAA